MVLSRQWGEDSGRARLKCDGTRAETRFGLSSKRTSPFKSAGGGGALHSTTGSRGVRISGSNAGYTMFRVSVKGIGYRLHSPVSPSFPPMRHRVPSHFNWSLRMLSLNIAVSHRRSPARAVANLMGLSLSRCCYPQFYIIFLPSPLPGRPILTVSCP